MQEVGPWWRATIAPGSAYELCQKQGVEMPIVEAAYGVLYRGWNARDTVNQLLMRRKKQESEDVGWD